VRQLRRVFDGEGGRVVAVKSLDLDVKTGETFGLLGLNGAGKSTTISMLCGALSSSGGDATFMGKYTISSDIESVQRHVGLCRQSDNLWGTLTPKEHLVLMCALRGIPAERVESHSEGLLAAVGLVPHRDVQSERLSGGGRRKLSLALSFVGSPSLVFLDEPTTGMDPGARRHVWSFLSKWRDAGKCSVLTTHSMEEADALCGRLGIMVNGEMVCCDTSQALKNRFGSGYTISMRCEDPEATDSVVLDKLRASFASATVSEESTSSVRKYIVALQDDYRGSSLAAVSRLFEIVGACAKTCGCEDFSASQTTLDEVFLRVARK